MLFNVIEQLLTYNYYAKEPWHKNRLTIEEALQYHKRLLLSGNIITAVDDKNLLGYIEVWRINYEQLGRLNCGLPLYTYDENINEGDVAYINNMYIEEGLRNALVYKELYGKFLERFGDCKFVAGKRFKYSDKFKVYPMSKIKGDFYER